MKARRTCASIVSFHPWHLDVHHWNVAPVELRVPNPMPGFTTIPSEANLPGNPSFSVGDTFSKGSFFAVFTCLLTEVKQLTRLQVFTQVAEKNIERPWKRHLSSTPSRTNRVKPCIRIWLPLCKQPWLFPRSKNKYPTCHIRYTTNLNWDWLNDKIVKISKFWFPPLCAPSKIQQDVGDSQGTPVKRPRGSTGKNHGHGSAKRL